MQDILPEDEIGNRDDLLEKTARVGEFSEALHHLDKYSWYRLVPMNVSAEFDDLVLDEVEKRGGKQAAVEWADGLKRRRFEG